MSFVIETCTCGLVCIALFLVLAAVVFVIPLIKPNFNIISSISRFNLINFYSLIVVVLTTTLAVLGAVAVFILRSYFTEEYQIEFVKNVICLAFYGGAAIIASIMGVLLNGVFNKISSIIFFMSVFYPFSF